MFNIAMIEGLSWQQIVPLLTPSKHYRVEITWALDRFRISVYTNTVDGGLLIRRKAAWYRRTAVETANKFLREFERRVR